MALAAIVWVGNPGSTGNIITVVRKRIETAALISEFLEFIKLPGQYHVARDYQVYSLFYEMLPLLSKGTAEEKTA